MERSEREAAARPALTEDAPEALAEPGVDRAFPGIPASPGVAIGTVRVLASDEPDPEDRAVASSEIEAEIARFRRAIERTRQDLLAIRAGLVHEVGEPHAKIFDAHLALLDDVMAVDATERAVREQGRSAGAVFHGITSALAEKFAQMENEYLRDRAADVRDVARRVLRHLGAAPAAASTPAAGAAGADAILVARDIPPSDAAVLIRDGVAGFATEAGGRTSHMALLAQERGVPAVVGVRGLSRHARDGMGAIVDGTRGLVLLDPSPARQRYYRKKWEQFRSFQTRLEANREQPAITRDGHAVGLSGNVSSPEEVQQVLERGGEGIGLFRTEYMFLGRIDLPDEDEQAAAYEAVAAALAPRPVILRTLDVGGDKAVPTLEPLRQRNPVLGVRGIRLSQEHEPLFRVQVRAILRASRHRNVRLMIPVVTRVEEMRWALGIVREECDALVAAGHDPDRGIEVGAMIETPAAVLIASALATVCDFFSIGSNDLTQYMLAVDRVNEHVAALYDPLHPAVLLGIRHAVDAARRKSIWVGLCGEMAVDPVALVLLVGFGVDEISTSAAAIPKLKAMIRALSFAEAEDLADAALELPTADEVRAFVTEKLQPTFPEMFA